MIKEQTIPYAHADTVLTPDDVYGLIKEYLQGADREHFIAVFLDAQSKVTGITTVSIGTLTESLVHAREVFKAAILANAASIIVAHNHPSGMSTPSDADISVTRKLQEAGRIVGIEVADHVIMGEDGYTSLKGEGLL